MTYRSHLEAAPPPGSASAHWKMFEAVLLLEKVREQWERSSRAGGVHALGRVRGLMVDAASLMVEADRLVAEARDC
jgi:hypothetical protein